MPLTPGSRIGVYEVVSMLGAGGMGEVYRARDSRLKRDVAIKVLPDLLAGDPDRLSRFQREAELLAALNHPNIAAVYGLEESGTARAIVLELVEGDTLAERIEKGLRAESSGLPVDEALSIARQIVDALEAAHERGVVHRDLKPANIKITPDGKVKVLDFGLAKMLEAEAQASSLSMSPTMSLHATYAGVILGTAAYMSPEQARGKLVDRRTDVWAFGCVLFEMLTAKKAFGTDGDTVSDAVAAVLMKEPDWTLLPASTPPHIASLIRRCLQKDAQKRVPHIGVARLEIDEGPAASAASAAAPVPMAQPWWRRAIPVAAAVALTAVAAGAAAWAFQPKRPSPIVTRFMFNLPDGQGFTNGGRQLVAFSPDGTRFVYVANQQLYLRTLSDLEARPIPGIDGSAAVIGPVFSPDGEWIAYYSGGTDTGLRKIRAAGGAPVPLGVSVAPAGMTWGEDGILLGQPQPERGILRVSPNGGPAEVIATLEPGEFVYGPQMLPGGKAVLFTVTRSTDGDRWDKAQIVVQPLPSGQRKVLVDGGADGRYLPSGHLVYARSGVVLAVPFDERRLQVVGGPVPIIEGVRRAPSAATAAAQFSVSAAGSIAYVPGPVSVATGSFELALIDRKGQAEVLGVPSTSFEHPRVSPDGKRIVFVTDDGKEAIVWIYELSGRTAMRRLTFKGRNRFPIWTSDGQRVAFQSDQDGDRAIFWTRADGAGTAERLTKPDKDVEQIPESWSPKGDGLLLRETRGAQSVLMFYSTANRTSTPFGGVRSEGPTDADFSPDGRWVAYEMSKNNGGDARAIYVQPFPATGATYQVPVIEAGGYRHPRWSPDGRELFYFIGGNVRAKVSTVTTQPVFAFGNAAPLQHPAFWVESFNEPARGWDVLPDGQHFLARITAGAVGQPGSRSQVQQIQVVLNWFEELKQRVPTK